MSVSAYMNKKKDILNDNLIIVNRKTKILHGTIQSYIQSKNTATLIIAQITL